MKTFWELTRKQYENEGEHPKYLVRDAVGNTYLAKTRREIIEKAVQVARWLKNDRVKHVGVYLDSSTDWISAYLGIVISGNVAVLLDRRLPQETIVSYVKRADVTCVVYDTMQETLTCALCEKGCQVVSLAQAVQDQSTEDILGYEGAAQSDALCTMVFTSGTTGQAKCVMLSQTNIVSNIVDTISICDYTADQSFLSVLPVAHAFGMTQCTLAPFFNGGDMLIATSHLDLLKNMQRYQPTFTVLIPMMLEFLYQRLRGMQKRFPQLSKREAAEKLFGHNLRYIGVGGAASNADTVRAMLDYGITVRPGYGMTENAPMATVNLLQNPAQAASIGEPMQHTQIKLVDGEIWIHSPSVMLGYYKDADATAEMLSDRWLKTGDLGRFDEKGALYLTGRKKNLIVLSSGENISPEYIEQLLRESESVREVCVSEKNDHILAEIYPTDAVLEKDAAGREAAVLEAVNQTNQRLPFYSRVMDITVRTKEFPKNIYGKIVRACGLF